MSETIDIKTKKIIQPSSDIKFEKSLVLENLEGNLITHWDTWGKFQQTWNNRAYKTFKDLDKYIVVIYLIQKYFQNLSSKFQYLSMDEFYDGKKVEIAKVNLIQISYDLKIPKETIRRKINELQNQKILIREGKSIIFNRYGMDFQKPNDTIDILSLFIQKKSKMLQGNSWFGEQLSKEQIKIFIKKYFTVIWLRFFKLQIPFLVRHRNTFTDLEIWMVWGNIALTHQYHLFKAAKENLLTENININNYYKNVINAQMDRGINASSISDITAIPRATVIRKLNWLLKKDTIKKNKNLEYQMNFKGKLNKKINENFKYNQVCVAEFLTEIFDYMKNSQFKI